MAVREILKIPDKRLRLVSEPVKRVDAGIRKLVDDMFETMYDAPGIGLAAIQIGVAKRVVTMDLSKKEDEHAAAGVHQSGDHLAVRRQGDLRGRLPVDPGILRGGRAAGRGQGQISRSRRQGARDRSRRACSRPACSTRSTTSTACCSSTISPSSSATASSRNSPRRRRRWRRDWRSAWSSWARRISPCRRWWRLSAAAMRSRRSIRRAPQPAGRGMAPRPSPVAREAARFGTSGAHAENAEGRRCRGGDARSRRRRGRGGRLRPDPAASRSSTRSRSAASICTPRCCRAGAARRRSIAPSWPATARPA